MPVRGQNINNNDIGDCDRASALCHNILAWQGRAWAPARGEQGGQAPTLEKIRVGMAHPGNFSRGLKTSWQ